jgi:3-hydroxyisobutyrate dehydrogenase-like beta-hydroxyacid dehydrogenase
MAEELSRRTFLKTTALAVGSVAAADVPVRGQEHRIRLRTVGIMSPGDMGSAVGRVLAKHGLKVVAALGERSTRTRALAAEAGIADVGTLENLVREADLVMSTLDPDAAIAAAQRVAEAMKATGAKPLHADCNSIAVQSARKIGETMNVVGAPLAEASIIGAPPRVPNRTRIYASGVLPDNS